MVKSDLVLMIRQQFAETTDTHRPLPGLSQLIFKLTTDAQFSNIPAPTLATRTTLVAKATQVISFIAK